ncbi:ricin-type beta-trefoil lectin domain protein [Streptomyces capitiformicae]|uniref:ricin-type beta-trefoil lectin domain protein n=1 Tax=Streptomyces capitiformicae TaxID=2014920 RepID=UPI001E5E5A36|nr:ricin-type beta-trefoil lectin domain protein [Streptomyces capitiformicae]
MPGCADCFDHAGQAVGDPGLPWRCPSDLHADVLGSADGVLRCQSAGPGRVRRPDGPGHRVQTWTCTGGADQQWSFNSHGTITGLQSGLPLEVAGTSTASGALLDWGSCNGGSNRQ